MKILVACEYSGIVRDAFAAKGHDAWSCDILPTESPGQHIQGDVLDYLDNEWDMMIAHPPCTYLANSGVQHLWKDRKKENGKNYRRWWLMNKGKNFFLKLLYNPFIPKIVVENPVPHGYAELPKYTQTIQPYQFGHKEQKRTCLWLKNLPKLEETDNVLEETKKLPKNISNRIWYLGSNKGKERSKFFPGIAKAMANQWG